MTNAFDAAAHERRLRAEADSWDTSEPVTATPEDIPTIDVGPWFASGDDADLSRVAAQLAAASAEVGFFELVGHGVSAAATDAVLEATRRFHGLPVEVRRTIEMDRPGWPLGGVGYLPLGERKLPRRARGNQNETFLYKSAADIASEDNQWLADEDAPGFRTTVESWGRTMEALALRLVPIYAAALGLPADHFDPAFVDPFWRLRLSHYPADPGERLPDGDDRPFGIAPHVDTTFFTILLQEQPGLYVYSHRRERWLMAPATPGSFMVNSGELLRQWSNDHVRSTRHFAANTSTASRYSVPFFFNANADYVMHPLPTCHGPDDPPKYPPFSYRTSQATVQGE